MTILIVEDEVLIGMALRMVLRVAGYRVRGPVARGDKALALAAKEPPDLALVDIGLAGPMPGTGRPGPVRAARHGLRLPDLRYRSGAREQGRGIRQ